MLTQRVLAYLRLLRAGTLFSPAADVIAGACLVGVPWSATLVRAAVASVAVYAAGMVLNDHADRAEDARQRPERPIPRGDVTPRTALILGILLLVVGVGISPIPGHHALLASLVLAYDYVLKRSPAAGAVTMGLLRGFNLFGGACILGVGLPNSQPLWIAASVYAIYIIAVTVLGILEDDPKPPPRVVLAVQTIPPIFAPLALLALPERWPAAAIGLGLALAFGMRARRIGRRWDRASIRASMTWLLLGTMAYTSLLCLGSGRGFEALGIALAIPVARRIARSIALT